jgi:hypothetical protein
VDSINRRGVESSERRQRWGGGEELGIGANWEVRPDLQTEKNWGSGAAVDHLRLRPGRVWEFRCCGEGVGNNGGRAGRGGARRKVPAEGSGEEGDVLIGFQMLNPRWICGTSPRSQADSISRLGQTTVYTKKMQIF